MPKYSVDVDVLRHALFDRALGQVGDSLLNVRVTSPIRAGAISLAPEGDLAVRVLNSAADKDEDGVFASGTNAHIAHDMQSAWIR